MKIEIDPNPETCAQRIAAEIASLIETRRKENRPAVLGLATGATPAPVYQALVQRYHAGLHFGHVITFNLDEYYPLSPMAPQSYHRYMADHLFSHIDLRPKNAHLPDSDMPPAEVAEACRKYEQAIQEAGGLDLQLLGVGRNGHIGFNEPGSPIDSRTRLITLDHSTLYDARSHDPTIPDQAITMGVGTILEARRIILLATGKHKATIVRRLVEEPISSDLPATFLRNHPNALLVLDQAAASGLKY